MRVRGLILNTLLPDGDRHVQLEWVMLLVAAVVRAPLRVVGAAAVDDQALIEAVARGEARSATLLYERLRPLVSRTIRRLASRASEHDDLVQQAFVELLISLRARPRVRSLDGWAATVAARTVYQRMRRDQLERRFAAPVPEDEVVEVAALSEGPLTAAVHREAVRKVAQHLTHVNANHVHVYLLHDVHGFELKEIAEILNITVANAQSRLVRGRADVRARIENDPDLAKLLSDQRQP